MPSLSFALRIWRGLLWTAMMMTGFIMPQLSQGQDVFRQPLNLTQNDQPAGGKSHMSRSSSGQLLWLPSGRLALAYWEGEALLTKMIKNVLTIFPCHVWYREWTNKDGWGQRQAVAQSFADGIEIGGRQPAMTLRPDGSLFTVWHDSRDSTTSLGMNLMNNVEIYGDHRPPDGLFGGDIRLTETLNPNNIGDNGYMPKIASLPDGRMILAWYDFDWDVYVSEIAIKVSDINGSFGEPSMASVIHTQKSDHQTGDSNQSFTVPNLAVDSDGIVHLVWATNITVPESSDLYYGRFDPDTKVWLEITRLRQAAREDPPDSGNIVHAGAGGQLDPAKIFIDPVSQDVWLAYTEFGTNGNNEIFLQRRAKGAPNFDPPINVTNNPSSQHYPDALMDKNGVIHLVYVDEAATDGTGIQYVAFDTPSKSITRQVNLSVGMTGDYQEPAISQDPEGYLYVVWEDAASEISSVPPTAQNGLWFTTTHPGPNAAHDWALYE